MSVLLIAILLQLMVYLIYCPVNGARKMQQPALTVTSEEVKTYKYQYAYVIILDTINLRSREDKKAKKLNLLKRWMQAVCSSVLKIPIVLSKPQNQVAFIFFFQSGVIEKCYWCIDVCTKLYNGEVCYSFFFGGGRIKRNCFIELYS